VGVLHARPRGERYGVAGLAGKAGILPGRASCYHPARSIELTGQAIQTGTDIPARHIGRTALPAKIKANPRRFQSCLRRW